MRRRLISAAFAYRGLAILLMMGVAVGQTKHSPPRSTPETSHLVFVKEYIRELISDETLRALAEKEFSEAKTDTAMFTTSLYIGKSAQIELRSQINMLKGMRLASPYDFLIPSLVSSYEQQIKLHQSLMDISTKLLSGPKPGIDYGAMAAKVPQLRAELENAQKITFDAAAPVFMTLIDSKPDSQNHLSHLVITKAEKADLQDQLEILLKDKPDKGEQGFYIGAAMILRGGFAKGHKCADEPWD